jgi:uncharacterized membrane protein (UPF0127 family)
VIDRSGVVLARELELASDSQTRRRGLLGRLGIAEGSAMIIAPCNAIHMFFMKFAIDVVFADRDGRVVKLCRNVRPWRMAIGLGGFAAIELSAGSIDQARVVKGDVLRIAQP